MPSTGRLHWLDLVYGTLMHRLNLRPQFFSKGWGGKQLELLETLVKQLTDNGVAQVSAANWPPPDIKPEWKVVWETRSTRLYEATLSTPCHPDIKQALPPESLVGRLRWLTPKAPSADLPHACVVHLAGTGDHGFERRLSIGAPLLKENISTLVLESPYYGRRRPRQQVGAKLQCVSDLLLLGRATIEEARAILHWLDAAAGVPRLGICGLSMGGVHAAMVGSLHPTPLAILPFLTPHSAAAAFCEGILQHGTAWGALHRDLHLSSRLAANSPSGAPPATGAAGIQREHEGFHSAEVGTASVATNAAAHAAREEVSLAEVRARMREVLSWTDVTRFPPPKNARAAIFVAARHDGYVPTHSVLALHNSWPGSEIRWVDGGHVSSFIFQHKSFQSAIRDGLSRL
eukprot:jgi/Mesen1/5806/ME000293S04958